MVLGIASAADEFAERETAEGWGMNFAARLAKSCCFSSVLLLLDWLQDMVHRRYDRISRILKRGV